MIKFQLNNKGFTLIEVLIGAIVFMISFTTLIIMLNNVFIKFSTKEYITAQQLARNYMAKTITNQECSYSDTTIEISGITFRIIRAVDKMNNYAQIRLSVFRLKTNKEIIKLYDEIPLSK